MTAGTDLIHGTYALPCIYVFIVILMFPFKVVQEDTINIALLHTGVIKMYVMIKFSLVILLIKTD